MTQLTDPRKPDSAAASTEARMPASSGLQYHGDRVSIIGVEVSKGKGDPLAPDPQRFEKDVVTRVGLKVDAEASG